MNRIVSFFMFVTVAAMALAGCKGGSALDLAVMGKAMSEAKSYRMTTVASGSAVTMEVECPDKMHTITKAGGNTAEMVVVGATTYFKMSGKWMKSPASGTSPTICAAAATAISTGAGSSGAAPEITKGDSTTVNGIACQEWNIKTAAGAVSYCIGSDNYPVQIKTGSATITYSDWNKVQVQTPQI